jgi:AcrR family transcriptional regulator
MSPGHIYHYFRNKEAIVAGIVEQRLTELLEQTELLRQESVTAGVVEAWMARVEPGIALRADKERTSLDVEILAEATRNEAVAAMVQEADAVARANVLELLKQLPALRKLPSKELAARLTVMNTLFDGLAVRTLCDPSMNRAATTRVIKRVIRALLEETD